MTALLEAIQRGKVKCLMVLIEVNVDLNKTDKEGRTPLQYAYSNQFQHRRCYNLLQLAQLLTLEKITSFNPSLFVKQAQNPYAYFESELKGLYRENNNAENSELTNTIVDIVGQRLWHWVSEQGRALLRKILDELTGENSHTHIVLHAANHLS